MKIKFTAVFSGFPCFSVLVAFSLRTKPGFPVEIVKKNPGECEYENNGNIMLRRYLA
jgi:hypothetical protein